MASSFIDFKGKGFWASDGFVEAFQLLLFEGINDSFGDQINWLKEYKKELALQSLPLVSGGMSMCFDETLTDPIKTEKILNLIAGIQRKIDSDANYLTGMHLNSLKKTVRQYLVTIKVLAWDDREIAKQTKARVYEDDVPINNYKRGFELLYNLVAGQIQYEAGTPITYWNLTSR